MVDPRCPIERAAMTTPEAPVIITRDRTYSYGALHHTVANMAARLARSGIAAGTKLGFAGHPDVSSVVLLAALFRLGAVACPLNPRWPQVRQRDCLRRIGGLWIADFPALNEDYSSEPSANPQSAIRIPQSQVIVFTSGSTGEPKGALLSYANLLANAALSNRNIPVGPGDCWLLSLSPCHVAGLGVLFRCWISGAAVGVAGEDEKLEDAVARPEVTHVSLVPTQLYRLLQSKTATAALARMKTILIGGSAVSPSLIQSAIDASLPICTSYGMTEMASQVTTTRPGGPPAHLFTSGPPLDPATITLAEDGEILVRGKTLFLGYVQGPTVELPLMAAEPYPLTPAIEPSPPTLHSSPFKGWFATGDLGRFDESGNLILIGRKDNRFVSGGENIQPEEIERCLCGLASVAEAVVAPLEDPEFGHVPVVFVRPMPGAEIDAAKIASELTQTLPRYMIPRHFLPWPATPETWASKPNRKELAEVAQKLISYANPDEN